MDVRLAMYQNEIEKIEDDMLPFGYFFDGVGDVDDDKEDDQWSDEFGEKWIIQGKKNITNPLWHFRMRDTGLL